MITANEIQNTYEQISSEILKTPLVYSPELSKISGANVYLKMENLQYTGSFKLRGVLSKIKSLPVEDFNKTFVAASTGNHAAAFAHVCQQNGLRGVLFLPNKTSPAKLKAIEHYDIDIRHYGENSMETEAEATRYAQVIGGVLVHPYNDSDIIRGQGTIAHEVKEQLPEVDTLMAPIGGGGLISGLASYFGASKDVEVIGCQPENAAEMHDSVRAGKIVNPSKLPTISDATAGGIEDGSMTFSICQDYVSDITLCPEEEIKLAIAFMAKHHQTLIEPGAALSVATLMHSGHYQGKNVVAVLTGKKININLLTEILVAYGNNY